MAIESNSDEFLLGKDTKNSNKVIRLADARGSEFRTALQVVNLNDRQKRIKEKFEEENGLK
tara:strand:+ start:699 stop:881 length:183 start_codon:yes stop_codon:yes gene_type:complete